MRVCGPSVCVSCLALDAQAAKRKAADAEASLAGLAGSLQQQLAALAAEVRYPLGLPGVGEEISSLSEVLLAHLHVALPGTASMLVTV